MKSKLWCMEAKLGLFCGAVLIDSCLCITLFVTCRVLMLRRPSVAWLALMAPFSIFGTAFVTKYAFNTSSLTDDQANSFPLGNGDIAANVWVSTEGKLKVLLAKSDSWDIYGVLLKLGQLEYQFDPNPFSAGDEFSMTLDPGSAQLLLRGTDGFHAAVYVDANQPVVRVKAQSSQAFSVSVQNKGWRTSRRMLGGDRSFGSCRDEYSVPDVVPAEGLLKDQDSMSWYHRNDLQGDESSYTYSMKLHGLGHFINESWSHDPLQNRTFGVTVFGDNVLRSSPTSLKSKEASKDCAISAVATLLAAGTTGDWIDDHVKTVQSVKSASYSDSWGRHAQYWRGVWETSYIDVEADHGENPADVFKLSQAHQLERYMMLVQGRGGSPIKFNGGLFVWAGEHGTDNSADYRTWGGGFWFQNTRQPYWSALQSGDFDMLKPLWTNYMNQLELLKARTRVWFGHEGIWIPETSSLWGLYLDGDYGCNRENRPVWHVNSAFVRYHRSTALELVYLMLQYFDYTQDLEFAKDILLPFGTETVQYFISHYEYDVGGKIVITPASALETLQDCINPTDTVAGIYAVLRGFIDLPEGIVPMDQLELYRAYIKGVPDLPRVQVDDGSGQKVTIIDAAERRSPGTQNIENVALYAVWPFFLAGHSKRTTTIVDAETIMNTYHRRPFPNNRGWTQDVVDAALLGLRNESKAMIVERYVSFERAGIFPTFWSQSFDYAPEVDHGETAKIALQYMILQSDGQKLLLLAGWPSDWDVSFKLAAPRQTTVQGVFRNGELQELNVTPSSRSADVVYLGP